MIFSIYEYLLTVTISSTKCVIRMWLPWPLDGHSPEMNDYFRGSLSIKVSGQIPPGEDSNRAGVLYI